MELNKLTQIEREDIIAVSIDCFGAVSSKEKTEDMPDEAGSVEGLLQGLTARCGGPAQSCREKTGGCGRCGRQDRQGRLSLGLPLYGKRRGIPFAHGRRAGRGADRDARDDAASARAGKFQTDMEEFSKDFCKCIMCKNCRDMCPVCYCIDCVFNGDEYLPKGDALLNKIFRTGSTTCLRGKNSSI